MVKHEGEIPAEGELSERDTHPTERGLGLENNIKK
jgi:hypothetical protein